MPLAVWVAVAVWACEIVPAASAATSLSSLRFAPDITVMLNGKRLALDFARLSFQALG